MESELPEPNGKISPGNSTHCHLISGPNRVGLPQTPSYLDNAVSVVEPLPLENMAAMFDKVAEIQARPAQLKERGENGDEWANHRRGVARGPVHVNGALAALAHAVGARLGLLRS